MKQANFSKQVANAWNRLPLITRAVLTGFLVSSVGIAVWTVLLSVMPAPWPVLPMIIALIAYCKFFNGRIGLRKTLELKRFRFRAIKLSPSVWKWSITAAIFFVVIVQASFVITFRLIDFPADKFTADYKILDSLPVWIAWVVLIMGSIVAGICEEVGFRGYMQVPLEKKYGPVAAIVITSIVFMLIHLSHSWAKPILPHIFLASVLLGILAWKSGSIIPGIIGHSILDIFDYSIWWSDITGGFKMQTIFKTGIDLNFIVWCLVFILGLFVFSRSVGRIMRNGLDKLQAQDSSAGLYKDNSTIIPPS
jgi:membrane protease YdiL (CAAX protease family)